MNYLFYTVMLLVDIVLTLSYSLGKIPLIFFLVLRLGLYLLFYRHKKKRKEKNYFFGWLIVLMPVGGTFVNFLFTSLNRVNYDKKIVDESFQWNGMVTEEEFEEEENFNLLPVLDLMKTDKNQMKKDLLINIDSVDLELQVKVLKDALLDDDKEIIHYAAVNLNELEKEFDMKIEALKKAFRYKHNLDSFNQLVSFYEKYLYCGIFEDVILDFHVDEYLKILEMDFEEKKIEKIMEKKVLAYILKHEEKELIEWIDEHRKAEPENKTWYKLLLRIYYTDNMHKEIRELSSKLLENSIELDDEMKKILELSYVLKSDNEEKGKERLRIKEIEEELTLNRKRRVS